MVPKGSVLAVFSLTNTGASPLPGKGWALYFTCQEGVETGVLQGHLTLERVTGALYRLRPTQGFRELSSGETLRIPLVHPDKLVNLALAPDGPYFVFDDNPEVGLPIADYEMAPFPANNATTPEQIYARNSAIAPVAENLLPPVLPTPREFERRTGSLRWTSMPQVVGQPALRAEIASAVAILKPYFPAAQGSAPAPAAASTVRLSIATIAGLPGPEAYELSIDPHSGVDLKACLGGGRGARLGLFASTIAG